MKRMKRSRLLPFVLAAAALLTGCGAEKAQTPDVPMAETPAAEETRLPDAAPQEIPVFPAVGEMLDADCAPYVPLADDGSRRVTVRWPVSDGTWDEFSYDLPGSRVVPGEPELTLMRQWNSGAGSLYTTPVEEEVDRAYLLGLLEGASFQEPDGLSAYPEDPWGNNLLLFVTADGTETVYGISPDGTLSQKAADGSVRVARQAADYFHLSALAYKYVASRYGVEANPEGWFAQAAPVKQWESPPDYPTELAADSYCLCVRGEGFHADLDRDQALILLRALFGAAGTGAANMPEFGVSPWNWTAPEGGIRLTEYLYDEYTTYQTDEPRVRERSIFLYPDGTAAQLPAADFMAVYRWRLDDGLELETITPSWQRVTVAEDAFSWETLTACLEQLS